METPIVFLCPSAKLQQEKSRVEKMDGMDISDKEQLAKLTCEVAELKQIIMASQNQVKIQSKHHDNSSVKLCAYI